VEKVLIKVSIKSASLVTSAVLAATFAGTGAAIAGETSSKNDPAREYTRGVSDPVPHGFSSWDALLTAQNQLTATADSIVKAAGSSTETGYGSIRLSVGDNRLTVYWKGQVPQQVQSAIDARPAGMTVNVSPTNYSLTDLQQQMTSLSSRAPAAGIKLTSVGPKPDSSGLQATVDGDITQAKEKLQSSIPLTITSGKAADPMFSRDADTTPYWGGAKYTTKKGGCSTGFAIRTQGTPAGSEPNASLTAGHCSSYGYGDDAWIGTSQTVNAHMFGFRPELDSAYLSPTPGGKTAPYIYRGPVGSSGYSGVASASGTYVGMWVCQGGAKTGEHCGAQVQLTEQTAGTVTHLARAEIMVYDPYFHVWLPDTNEIAAGHGDSGGPVFVPVPNTSKVYATGHAVGVGQYGQFSCPQYGTTCSSGFSFVPVNYVLQALGSTLATTP
jgi:hypothetical protein